MPGAFVREQTFGDGSYSMTDTEAELATIGFGFSSGEPVVWRSVCLGPKPRPSADSGDGLDPAASPALKYWRAVLARGARRSPYRISRVRT